MNNFESSKVKAEIYSCLSGANSFVCKETVNVVRIRNKIEVLIEKMFFQNGVIRKDIRAIITWIPIKLLVRVWFIWVDTATSEYNKVSNFKEDAISNVIFHYASVIKVYKNNLLPENVNVVTKAIIVSEILALMIIASSSAFVSGAV